MFSFCELQKALPPLAFPELGSCDFIQSFLNNKLNSMVELAADKGSIDVLFLEAIMLSPFFCFFVFQFVKSINHLFLVLLNIKLSHIYIKYICYQMKLVYLFIRGYLS